ncbi:hypothetical protein H1P_1040004 [Hyella patelloides LEGE 07179]|uniref:Uncharacterized protein n=1 Tax=Hyella patelloides LEGE 07179 TaxID=945734 RepID=A0A563VJ11_9CYAN|nr:hypothetical protein H1P_1040004 [Hyella patelloides LEGE 07179]
MPITDSLRSRDGEAEYDGEASPLGLHLWRGNYQLSIMNYQLLNLLNKKEKIFCQL